MVVPVHDVSGPDRAFAKCVCYSILVAVVGCVVATLVGVVLTSSRFRPPLVTSFVNGKEDNGGLSKWGYMPYLLVRTQKTEGSITCLPMSDTLFKDAGLGAHAEDTFRAVNTFPKPSCTSINRGAVLIDFTMLIPSCDANSTGGRGQNRFAFPCLPTIDIRFVVKESDGVDLFFAYPGTPFETLHPPWADSMKWIRYIGGVGDIGELTGSYANTQVRKSILPKKRQVFWGFNPFADDTQESLQFTLSGYHPKQVPFPTQSASPDVNFGWQIQIPDAVMMRRTPVTVVSQIVALIASVGGLLAVSTCLFYCVFVKQYPPSEDDRISSRLALRWNRRSQREVPDSFVATDENAGTPASSNLQLIRISG